MEAILGVQDIHVVSVDGSPSGRKVSRHALRLYFKLTVRTNRTGTYRVEPSIHRQGECQTRSSAYHLGGIEGLQILDGQRCEMHCLLQGMTIVHSQFQTSDAGLVQIRKFCELLMKQVRADLMTEGRSDMAGRVMSYRSGYSAQVCRCEPK